VIKDPGENVKIPAGPHLLKTFNDLGYQQKAYAVIPDRG